MLFCIASFPDLDCVNIVHDPQRLHVHSAHSDTLGAVEPLKLLVGR
jgi:hypothetical protein